jgi:hypothetical protein
MAMRKGALIGLLSGLLSGAAMLLWLVVYSFVRPTAALGSTAILGPVMGGVQSTVLGILLGAGGGGLCGLFQVRLAGPMRAAVFGAIVMGIAGIVETIGIAFRRGLE